MNRMYFFNIKIKYIPMQEGYNMLSSLNEVASDYKIEVSFNKLRKQKDGCLFRNVEVFSAKKIKFSKVFADLKSVCGKYTIELTEIDEFNNDEFTNRIDDMVEYTSPQQELLNMSAFDKDIDMYRKKISDRRNTDLNQNSMSA